MNISDTLRAMHGFPCAAPMAAGEPQPLPTVLEASGVPAVETAAISGTEALDRLPLGISYVPMQSWSTPYDGLQALSSGTIFPELNLPFCGRRLSK